MATRIFGSGIKRREDPRLITGKSKYTDDMSLPGMLYMAIVRSPHAHARIKSIDTSAAKGMPTRSNLVKPRPPPRPGKIPRHNGSLMLMMGQGTAPVQPHRT